jgi:hypothetical protein
MAGGWTSSRMNGWCNVLVWMVVFNGVGLQVCSSMVIFFKYAHAWWLQGKRVSERHVVVESSNQTNFIIITLPLLALSSLPCEHS